MRCVSWIRWKMNVLIFVKMPHHISSLSGSGSVCSAKLMIHLLQICVCIDRHKIQLEMMECVSESSSSI